MTRPAWSAATLLAVLILCSACSSSGSSSSSQSPLASRAVTVVPSAVRPSQALSQTPPDGAAEPSETAPDGAADETPTRLVIADLGVDLPVVSGGLQLPANPPDYPLCDVAQYLTTYPYPGRAGTTTWIYGHAREGMLLPLLTASERNDGRTLIGQRVVVYGSAGHAYSYTIERVIRHATDRTAAAAVPANQRRLILQTSEGPSGTIPKLQVVAAFLSVKAASPKEANPSPQPRVCAAR